MQLPVASSDFKLSEDLVSKAYAQAEAEERLWTRGLIPKAWMEVPPPIESELRTTSGNISFESLATGAFVRPLFVFGDASGGIDTHLPLLRR
eukprot:1052782-Pyramimonas_sp.AAC.1